MSGVTNISDHPRFKRERESFLSKRELSRTIGYSTRWIELRHRDGLPFHRAPNGYARYLLSEVEPWIAEWLEDGEKGA